MVNARPIYPHILAKTTKWNKAWLTAISYPKIYCNRWCNRKLDYNAYGYTINNNINIGISPDFILAQFNKCDRPHISKNAEKNFYALEWWVSVFLRQNSMFAFLSFSICLLNGASNKFSFLLSLALYIFGTVKNYFKKTNFDTLIIGAIAVVYQFTHRFFIQYIIFTVITIMYKNYTAIIWLALVNIIGFVIHFAIVSYICKISNNKTGFILNLPDAIVLMLINHTIGQNYSFKEWIRLYKEYLTYTYKNK